MKTRQFGDLTVSAIGLGCMTMTGHYGPSDSPADQEEARATLRRAVELGVTLFDTANVYGLGENEKLVGPTLKPWRDRVVLATKFGFARGADGKPTIDGHPDRIEARCDESLERLGFDHIDLYILHRVDPAVPIEDTVGAMAQLVESGKVRHLGLSEVNADTLRRAHAVHPIAAVQSEYSLWTRDREQEMIPTCAELGVGFMPFSPLGRAMLTGAIQSEDELAGDEDRRSRNPRFTGDNLAHNRALVAQFEAVADQLDIAPAQLALAWVLAKGNHIAPIPGTRRRTWLEQNVAAADVQLSAEVVDRIQSIFVPDAIAGDRYDPSMLRLVQLDDS